MGAGRHLLDHAGGTVGGGDGVGGSVGTGVGFTTARSTKRSISVFVMTVINSKYVV